VYCIAFEWYSITLISIYVGIQIVYFPIYKHFGMEKEKHWPFTVLYWLMLPILPGYLIYEIVQLARDPTYSATLQAFTDKFNVNVDVINVNPFYVLFYLLEIILGICTFIRLFIWVVLLVYQIFARGSKKSQIWKKKNQKKEKKEKNSESKVEGEDSELGSVMEEVDESSEAA
jgi:hypothetical protein